MGVAYLTPRCPVLGDAFPSAVLLSVVAQPLDGEEAVTVNPMGGRRW